MRQLKSNFFIIFNKYLQSVVILMNVLAALQTAVPAPWQSFNFKCTYCVKGFEFSLHTKGTGTLKTSEPLI